MEFFVVFPLFRYHFSVAYRIQTYGIIRKSKFRKIKTRNFRNSVYLTTELWKFRIRFRGLELVYLIYGNKNYGEFRNSVSGSLFFHGLVTARFRNKIFLGKRKAKQNMQKVKLVFGKLKNIVIFVIFKY